MQIVFILGMFEGLLETEVVFSNINKCPDCFRSMHLKLCSLN